MWLLFAILSVVFVALTSILAKVGVEGVNSSLATAIRTVVVLAMAWGMVFMTNGFAIIRLYKWGGGGPPRRFPSISLALCCP